MSTSEVYPHLTIGTDGTPLVDNTRYKVQHLAAEHYCYGWSAEELLRQHPDLRPEQVYAALTYFYDHYEAMVDQLRRESRDADAHRAAQKLSRAELLARKSQGS